MVRLAATVMLVRPATHAFEVFMVRRSEASHFVPNAYVFPGGTVDRTDMSARAFRRARGIDRAAVAEQFRAEPPPQGASPVSAPTYEEAAGLLIAGVRELFEEAGVLLVCDAGGNSVAVRDPDRVVDFFDLLERMDLYADTSALALFSHWITPPALSRRYNAHFFVAMAPAGQDAAADACETHDGVWIAPREALDRYARGDIAMVYPTIKHVERLASFDSAEALMRFARTKTIYSIMPQTAESTFTLPPQLEHAW